MSELILIGAWVCVLLLMYLLVCVKWVIDAFIAKAKKMEKGNDSW